MVTVVQPPPAKQVTCLHCQAVLAYTLQDIHEGISRDYTGGADRYKYVICPCCTNNVVLRRT